MRGLAYEERCENATVGPNDIRNLENLVDLHIVYQNMIPNGEYNVKSISTYNTNNKRI